MKITDFTDDDFKEKFDYDVVEDLYIFMKNDPMFYRKEYYPVVSAISDSISEDNNARAALLPVINKGLNKYCEKYNIKTNPKEFFKNEDVDKVIDRIVHDDIEQEQDK